MLSAADLGAQPDALKALARSKHVAPVGIPYVVKDNIDLASLPTTAACPDYDYIADADSTCVRRALILDKSTEGTQPGIARDIAEVIRKLNREMGLTV